MRRNLVEGEPEGLNRRQLLGASAALVGGAVFATAFEPAQVFGEEKAAPRVMSSTPPNLDPPVVQV